MNLALFSQMSVRDFYDTNVVRAGERRVFGVPDAELCVSPSRKIIDDILAVLEPGRLVLDPVMREETCADTGRRTCIRRWLEYTGSVDLLSLRPRQYYASPPHVSALQPPNNGQAGRIVIEHTVAGIDGEARFNEFCATEFRKITDYAGWMNADLDYHEKTARAWLLSLVETKKKRLCAEAEEQAGAGTAGGILTVSSAGIPNLSMN